MRKLLAVLLFLGGLIIGFSASTVTARLEARPTDFDVEVLGELGAPVSVTTSGDTNAAQSGAEVVIEGDGREIEEDGQVLYRATAFSSSDSGWTRISGETGPINAIANEDNLSSLTTAIVGQSEGSRVLVTNPRDAGEPVEIVVVDLLPTLAYGANQVLPASNGMPGVSVDEAGMPTVESGGGTVSELRTELLVQGEGVQVAADSTIIANYLIVGGDGTVEENTWEGAPAATLDLTEVFPGLRAGLSDQRVGSRVVVAIPAAQAQGDADTVVIVDILAVLDASDAEQ